MNGRRGGLLCWLLLPWLGTGCVTTSGVLDKEVIRRVVRSHVDEVQSCYERGLRGNPTLNGRVEVRFTISSSGAVSAVAVRSSTLNSPPVEMCIAQAVHHWQFPKPQDGIFIVTYPFVLHPMPG